MRIQLTYGIALAGFLIFASSASAAKKLTLTTDPKDAKIFSVGAGGSPTSVPHGEFKLRQSTTFLVEREGWKSKKYTAIKGRHKGPFHMELIDRLVQLTTEPTDADVYQDGMRVPSCPQVEVPKGTCVEIEVKKRGYGSVKRDYCNHGMGNEAPMEDEIRLTRVVKVKASPIGAMIAVNGVNVGRNADVVVPEDDCVDVEVAKEGFVPKTKKYCGGQSLPQRDEITLTDWRVLVMAAPDYAMITAGQREAQGSLEIVVRGGKCKEVAVTSAGFVSVRENICNHQGLEPPLDKEYTLEDDEAYQKADVTDQANKNFTIEVNALRDYNDAWKLLGLIVLESFDVLENSDRETGYLRTAWHLSRFETRTGGRGSTVRTRVIVKLASYEPTRFLGKIESEYADDPRVKPKEDDKFKEWDRVLKKYAYLFDQLQIRLKLPPDLGREKEKDL